MCAPTSDPFSTMTTEHSGATCFKRMAAESPAGPAPTMTTSNSIASRAGSSFGLMRSILWSWELRTCGRRALELLGRHIHCPGASRLDARQSKLRLGQHPLDKELAGHQLCLEVRVRSTFAEFSLSRFGNLTPHVCERDEPKQLQIVAGAAANEVTVLRAVLGEPLRGLLQMTQSFTRARDKGRQTGIVRVLLEETLDLREIGADHLATLEPELATDEVESLNAVRPFVDL